MANISSIKTSICKFSLLLVFYVGNAFTLAAQNDTTYLLFSSGAPGKAYFEDAKIITKILNNHFKTTRVVNIQSSGSEENFKRLAQHSADFIIAQRDIACDHYYSKENAIRNFQILMPLFPEAVQIFVRAHSGLISLSEFKRMVAEGKIKKIAIGPAGGACNITVRDLLNILEIHIEGSRFDDRPEAEAFNDFSVDSSNVDAIAFYSSPPVNFIQNLKLDSVGIVNFSDMELRPMKFHYKNLEEIKFSADAYPFLHTKDTINAIGTWAFLFVNSDVSASEPKEEIDSISATIINEVLKNEIQSHIYHTYSVSEIELTTAVVNGKIKVKNTKDDLDFFFKGMPINSGLQEVFDYYPDNHTRLYVFLIALLLLAVAYYFYLGRNTILINYWYKYRHWLVAIFFASLIIVLCITLIKKFEEEFYASYGTQSPMLNLGWQDILKWLLLAKLANHDSSIFPVSAGGQIAATIPIYATGTTLGLAVVYQFILNYKVKKRRMGQAELKLKNHYVICGWNDKTPELIKDFLTASKNYSKEGNIRIVVITDKIESTEPLGDKIETAILSEHLNFVKGEAREDKILKKACIEHAKTIILVSEDKDSHSDEKNLLRALAIARYCKNAKPAEENHFKKAQHTNLDQSYIIAEINDQSFKSAFDDADVDEVICTGEMINKLVTQSAFNHGVSEVMSSILTYDEENEIYTIKIADFPHLVNHTYDELLSVLRKKDILLMGIRRNYLDDAGNEILDKKYLRSILTDSKYNHGFEEQNVINPKAESAKKYKTQAHDYLIVLASSEKEIMKLKKELHE